MSWITELKLNEVFVFGSNTAGRHGRGAAKQALKFGAKHGVGFGHQGNTFAIPTKDSNIRTLPLYKIAVYVEYFIQYAKQHPNKIFLVTEIGCGLAGYKPKQIAPLFKNAVGVENIILPERFKRIL